MGRIPNFTNSIFPPASLPNINLVAQLGLIFFLFIVGMEIDIPYLRKHWKIAASVGGGSVILPFSLGYAVAIGLYNEFVDKDTHISFGTFGLFIAIAISITALPVLARILTELGLLHDTSGIMVLAAGVSNDIVAWVLLALVISLAHAGAPIDTLYILLCAIGWFLLLAFGVRPILYRFLKRTGSIDKGPTEFAVIVILLMAFVSSFFTDVIGVHSMFGSFIAGAIIPRENNFPAKLTEKIEDLVTAIFIPIYFAISGFKVNLDTLNDGKTWGYTILVIVIAFVGKVLGSAVPARLLGLGNKEAVEVGILMSCKGLVELVILNVGLEAGILNTKLFSMFVLMAIVTTFATTPLTVLWRNYMAKRETKKQKDQSSLLSDNKNGVPRGMNFKLKKIVLAFDNEEMLTSNMVLTQMLANPEKLVSLKSTIFDDSLSAVSSRSTINHQSFFSSALHKDIFVSAVHLVDLTDRTADLIQAMAGDFLPAAHDPLMKVMNTFTALNHIPFEGYMSIAPYADRMRIIMSLSEDPSDLLFVSWADFRGEIAANKRLLSKSMAEFSVREGLPVLQAKMGVLSGLFSAAKSHTCAFIDRGFSGSSTNALQTKPQVVVPFFGGNDDWLAFGIGLYLAKNQNVQVTVLVETPVTICKNETHEIPNPPERAVSPSRFGLKRGFGFMGNKIVDSPDSLDSTVFNVTVLKGKENNKGSPEISTESVWDTVTEVYNELPTELQSSVTLTKFSHSPQQQEQEEQSDLTYTEALKLYRLGPHDLVIMGRSTRGTENKPMLAEAPHASFRQAVLSEGIDVVSANETRDEESEQECLFGTVAGEIVGSSEIQCSMIVCQAAQTSVSVVVAGNDDAADILPAGVVSVVSEPLKD